MDPLLVRLAESSAGDEDARRKLYRDIIDKGSSPDDNISNAFENRRGVILRVLVKGTSHMDSSVVRVGLSSSLTMFILRGR